MDIDNITVYFADNGAYLEYCSNGDNYRNHREVYPSVQDACDAVERIYDETKNKKETHAS